MNKLRIISILFFCLFLFSCGVKKEKIVCYGDAHSNLARLLTDEGYQLHFCTSVTEALRIASEQAPVLLLCPSYPEQGTVVTSEDLALIQSKSLRVFMDFPQQIGEHLCVKTDTMELERIVVCDSLTPQLPSMALMAFHRCVLKELDLTPDSTYLVAARVAGFDKAVYGLANTPVHPLLYQQNNQLMVAATSISNFAVCRYLPEQRVQSMFEYIMNWLLHKEGVTFSSWLTYVSPSYTATEPLPEEAGKQSIAKGVEWYYNGHFLVHPSWKKDWADKYMGDGLMPVGPELPADMPDGDGSLGVLEGHMSGIKYDGTQMYRYWMRDDVQGETSFAFAAAGTLLDNSQYTKVAANLLDYSFTEYRDSVRNDPKSPSYGLLGWAYTHKGTYYGDDNARSLLGSIASSALMNNPKWDKQIVEGIVGNFRTTGLNGFRGQNILESDLQKRGWKSYYNANLVNLHAHFEAWNWACYLWLYNQTHYQPLLERVKRGITMMMEGYPEQWSWTNGIQQERARMILPLAWLYRVEPTEEHLDWLHFMTNELLRNQVPCGGIREELGDESKSLFGRTPSNAEYGNNEAPLIFDNGDPVADMLYTTNFAFVGLCEAAKATQDTTYIKAVNQMRDFLIRIQVRSDKFKNVDGAWFRAFNYEDWNYWASNADAGWGVWSTLTGWIQSWHMSGIKYDGTQMYRYWMRDDVQGETSFAFAAAGTLLDNSQYTKVAANLLDYSFTEYRDSVRNDPKSPSYGLLGWAYTHKGTYYGDDNARSLLGSIASSALMNNPKWDKQIVEGIVGNFRTTGLNGFRGQNILESDLQKRGWKSYYNANLVNLHAHFEAWNWACYLWLYNQTHYQPLLERVKRGITMMMEGYPEQWSWTNGIQQERARMILPLAWLYRVEPTEEHLDWLHFMTNELLRNQVPCGGIREELGDESKSLFGRTPSNAEYGNNEAPLIFDNGDPVADMLYTTNFAFVGLCEAAKATQDTTYIKAVNQMRDFLIRIQVRSDKFKNVDGAWFRAFNYEDWNYWASNADAGWGVWSTLTGWIQSWIVGTQFVLEEDSSLWDIANQKDVSTVATKVIEEMITRQL